MSELEYIFNITGNNNITPKQKANPAHTTTKSWFTKYFLCEVIIALNSRKVTALIPNVFTSTLVRLRP